MLYLNSGYFSQCKIVFAHLTLTNVVFEYGEEVWKCLGRCNLTLTNVVFE